jgi:hypothetical protein
MVRRYPSRSEEKCLALEWKCTHRQWELLCGQVGDLLRFFQAYREALTGKVGGELKKHQVPCEVAA